MTFCSIAWRVLSYNFRQLIVRHFKVYYPVRHALIQHIVSSIQKLGLTPNVSVICFSTLLGRGGYLFDYSTFIKRPEDVFEVISLLILSHFFIWVEVCDFFSFGKQNSSTFLSSYCFCLNAIWLNISWHSWILWDARWFLLIVSYAIYVITSLQKRVDLY